MKPKPDTAIHPLVRGLVRRQNEMGMNDTEFAADLGLRRITWTATRHERLKPGVTVARVAMRYPELQPFALEILNRASAAIWNVPMDTGATVSDTASLDAV